MTLLPKAVPYTRCYKVLVQTNKKLYSFNYTHKKEIKSKNATLRYVNGQWTNPKIPNSKLFVFGTLKNAQQFVEQAIFSCPTCRESKFVIYECLATNFIKTSRHTSIDFYDFAKYWENPDKFYSFGSIIPAAQCNSLFLIKRVE